MMMTRSDLLRMCAASAMSLALFAGTAGAALAQNRPVTVYGPAADTFSEVVSFADLNLADRGGRQLLDRRIDAAVSRVCSFSRYAPMLSSDETVNCARAAWLNAQPQVALAVKRAEQLAINGYSTLPQVAIAISAL